VVERAKRDTEAGNVKDPGIWNLVQKHPMKVDTGVHPLMLPFTMSVDLMTLQGIMIASTEISMVILIRWVQSGHRLLILQRDTVHHPHPVGAMITLTNSNLQEIMNGETILSHLLNTLLPLCMAVEAVGGELMTGEAMNMTGADLLVVHKQWTEIELKMALLLLAESHSGTTDFKITLQG